MSDRLTLSVLPRPLAVCRLPSAEEIPDWVYNDEFCSITRTANELSIVCLATSVPANVRNVQSEKSWRALEVRGPLDFSLTGILAGLTQPLAQERISVFVVATFDTDYILVRSERLTEAISALRAAGYTVLHS